MLTPAQHNITTTTFHMSWLTGAYPGIVEKALKAIKTEFTENIEGQLLFLDS